ncbi:MAG: chemotaxis protein CheB [Ignavibacteria bacterium]
MAGGPVVAVVLAAGAAKALRAFFGAMPQSSGAAFVLLDPSDGLRRQPGERLRAATGRQAVRVAQRIELGPERLHLVPGRLRAALADDVIYPVGPARGQDVDFFLCALAEEREGRAVAVLLGDWKVEATRGIDAIEGHAGIVVADKLALDAVSLRAPADELGALVGRHIHQLPGDRPAHPMPDDIEMIAAAAWGEDAPPAGVLVDRRGEVLYVWGRTGAYLEPPSGHARWNIYAMARPALREALLAMMPEAFFGGERIVRRLSVETDDAMKCLVDLIVKPLPAAGGFASIGFGEAGCKRSRHARRDPA